SRHTRCYHDWSSDVCSSDLCAAPNEDVIRVNKIRVDVAHANFHRLRIRFFVVIKPFLSHIEKSKSDNHTIDVRPASCFAAPFKRSEERRVGKGDKHWIYEKT